MDLSIGTEVLFLYLFAFGAYSVTCVVIGYVLGKRSRQESSVVYRNVSRQKEKNKPIQLDNEDVWDALQFRVERQGNTVE